MRFIETPIFTDQISGLLEDEEYRALQMALLLVYRKSKQDDLAPAQLERLRRLVRRELK